MFKLSHLCRNVVAGLLLSMSCLAHAASISSFGIAVLPDTQFYSRYNSTFISRYGNEPFSAQTTWIANNATTLGIPFVIHLGDVVDQQNVSASWGIADTAMKILETNTVPYSILAGNHDVVDGNQTDVERTLASEPYLQWFPTSRAAKQSTFQARDGTGFAEYHIFTFQGQQYMSLALGWNASQTELAWAASVIQANPTIPVILSSHNAMYIDSDGVTAIDSDYGNYLWANLISNNDQIFMVINGHNHGSAYKTRTNNLGHTVLQVVVDYQMSYMGGNGYMRLFEFDLTNNLIKALTFSPWVPEKPTSTLNSTYDLALLEQSNNEYTVSMNFAQRFAGFAPNFSAGNSNRTTPLVETVRSSILASYQEPAATVTAAPYDSDDYPHNSSTIAHWRFSGGTNGQSVPEGAAVADLTGANPLTRVSLANGAQLSDLAWSSDHHSLSAATGSVHFANSSNLGNWFVTAANAALNNNYLTNGFTIEAIVKMDPKWTSGANAWMNIMTRGGQRQNISGWYGSYGTSSPLQFAFSNLKEVQFEPTVYYDSYWRIAASCWSGEIMVGQWIHIAIVNDPATSTTTMYVDGAPVLRNYSGYNAIAGVPNEPWVVGGQVDGASGGGFFGYISEIRISDSALNSQSQWLTARKNRVKGNAGQRQTLAGTSVDDEIFCNQASCTLTGNGGADTFVFDSMRNAVSTITDFNVGQNKINLHGVLTSINYAGNDPLGDGTVKLTDNAAGALVQIKVSGTYRTLITLKNVTAANGALASNFIF
ncbi:MAG: metallophosphoesterase [Chthoniobacteraceae bacterium]